MIIWGASPLCKCIAAGLNVPLSRFMVWDSYKTNTSEGMEGFENVKISKPQLTDPDIDLTQNAYIILAFSTERNYKECAKTLSIAGYKNIIEGSKLMTQIEFSKIKSDYDKYKLSNSDNNFTIDDHNLYIFPYDHNTNAGAAFNDAYLVQDLWAAQKVFKKKPSMHYDIGSRVDGFITHLLSFAQNTVLIDIRPLDTYGVENLTFIQDDATNLSNIADDAIESISALCSLEHFGLGRYGDPIDPDAHKKVFQNIQRVLKKGGDLYLSLPVAATCRLEFNAHRIYSPSYVLEKFALMDLIEFSCVSHDGLRKNVPINIMAPRNRTTL